MIPLPSILTSRTIFRITLGILTLLFSGKMGFGQFSTPAIDGAIAVGEYGLHLEGLNQQTNGATTWYLAWDANNLYLAYTGSNVAEGAVLYLDFNPIIPVNGGSDADGSIQGFYTYDRNHMQQPFRADFALYFKSSYHEFRHADGAGYWGAQTAFTLPLAANGGTNTIEISIPWNTVTNGGGMPATFNWFAYKVYDYGPGTNGVYDPVPVGNPACACNSDPSILYPAYYYNILSTAALGTTFPFSTTSLCYYQDNSGPGQGYYQNGGSFYDITINDNSTDNTDNDPANHVYNNLGPANRLLVEGGILIGNNLYIGQGSALLPADNPVAQVLATLSFVGTNGSIYNYGRLDPNPESFNPGDEDNRRIDLVFGGTTTIQPSNLFKDRYRFSNVTVNPGGTLQGPGSDSASIELQWGTLDVNGNLVFGGSTGGHVDLGTRGDWSQHNDYFFNSSGGTGDVELHDILIGRNSSHLQPVSGGGAFRMQLMGDFENYDEFTGFSNGGRIDVVMGGTKRQYLKGNVTETTGATTSFHNFEIANNDGVSQNNDAADVHFESNGGGLIDYFITGELTLTSGDLITRDRSSSLVHSLTLRDSATVNVLGGSSNLPSNISCMVDGPISYEVENANLVNRVFPVGKSLDVGGYTIGDFRPLGLSLDHDAATRTTYTAEMFLADRSTFYTWPSPIPETIVWISMQRYWNVTKSSGGANLQSAVIGLSYDLEERNDGVNNAAGLRIVKDDGFGNWVNITPLGPGGSANWTGTITSQPFVNFSDFTLASIDNGQPLPVNLVDFQARYESSVVNLTWTTEREINLDRFVVERSLDRESWKMVGEEPAIGNSATRQRYNMTDVDLPDGPSICHYRLRLQDGDGSFAYSDVRTLSIAPLSEELLLWPNPSSDFFFVDSPEAGTLGIQDALGREVFRENVDPGMHEIRHGLSHGVYMVRLSSPSGRSFQHRILVRGQ